MTESELNDLRKAFALYDQNGDGCITLECLKKLINDSCEGCLTEDEINQLVIKKYALYFLNLKFFIQLLNSLKKNSGK